MTKSDTIEKLAARLYWKMEHTDPDFQDFIEWENLPWRAHRLYKTCVEDLLAHREMIEEFYRET